MEKMSYTIKQVAGKLGLSPAALRYYDSLGIVSPERTQGGYRYYSEADIEALRYVAVMKYAHFPLDEIKAVMERFQLCAGEPNEECNMVCKNIFLKRLEVLHDSMRNLEQIALLLEQLLPLMDNAEKYVENVEQIGNFIKQIYQNIEEQNCKTAGAKA